MNACAFENVLRRLYAAYKTRASIAHEPYMAQTPHRFHRRTNTYCKNYSLTIEV